MSEEFKDRLRRGWDRTWNHGDQDAIDELYAADVVIHQAAPGTPAGIEGVRASVGATRAAFPDLQFTAGELVVDGDMIANRWSLTGTQQGEFRGAPATGQKTTMGGLSMMRIANNKIAEIWTAFTPSN
jgi:predicted ester cyclase